jgi:hypothetical protein
MSCSRARVWSRRGGLVPALLVLLVLPLSACVQIPDSGPVRAGPEVSAEDEPELRYVPSGPRPGADPAAVVNGYLYAMRAYPANPGIVRQFLTERAAGTWSPSAGTQIYTESPELEDLGGGRVRMETDLLARLTSRGTWTEPPHGRQLLRQQFRLRREGGEWRITNPASGLLVPEYDFDRYYRPYSLYFFDPAHRVLVPDPVYLPEGDQTATLLLRGLLQGPTPWLRGAVDSELPPTSQADVSVPVTDAGVAQVQLGSQARGLGAAERDRLAAQLTWTLRQVPEVESVRVTVNGAPLPLEGGGALTDVRASADYDPADSAASQALFALRGSQVVTVDRAEGIAHPLPGRFGTGRVPVSAFAVERTAQTVAAVTGGGTRVEVAPIGSGESRVWFRRGRDLLGLQWDIHGLLWAVDRTRTGSRVYVMRDGRWAPVTLGPGAPDDIRAFSLSRDGLRLAVVEGRGAASRVLLGRVRRPAGGALALSVDHWREVEPGATTLGGFVDVAWSGPTALTVAAVGRTGSTETFTMSIDGSTVEPGALLDLGVTSVADAPVVDLPALAATRAGSLYAQQSDRWDDLGLQGVYRQPSYVE